jgi:thiosulfate dehydrogenase [quinone] large subunit
VSDRSPSLTTAQQAVLVTLRTLIGWHFLYEGYYKLVLPGWSAAGQPVADWSAAGYLAAATGPLAGVFHWLGSSAMVGWVDVAVVVGLIAAGASLMLGLFTRAGAAIALVLLSLFYLANIPLAGQAVPGAEGTYLLVNKTLVEWAAVLVMLVFPTGRMAGLDLLRAAARRRASFPRSSNVTAASAAAIPEKPHGTHA